MSELGKYTVVPSKLVPDCIPPNVPPAPALYFHSIAPVSGLRANPTPDLWPAKTTSLPSGKWPRTIVTPKSRSGPFLQPTTNLQKPEETSFPSTPRIDQRILPVFMSIASTESVSG